MNVFVLDEDPSLAAKMHCDKHLGKMILESAQMLSAVAQQRWPGLGGYYKPTHQNHPCTKWVGESLANARWLVRLCQALDDERLAASNCDPHSSLEIVERFNGDFLLGEYLGEMTPFVFAGPADTPGETVVEKYRNYYRAKNAGWVAEGKGAMVWKNREVPAWF